MSRRIFVAGLLTTLCVTPLLSDVSQSDDEVERSLESFTRSLDTWVPQLLDEFLVPGAAVAVIENGRVVHQEGYGFANREQKMPVSSDTGFNIGSISKTVAAWGLLKLVEDGKIDIDAPVSRYVKIWKLPDSKFDANGVTLRRLLSHTAGLSLHGYPGFGPDASLPSLAASLSGETNGSGAVFLESEPGTRWSYSGGGYTLAQLMVEEVTGRKFAEYMRTEILRPLGMTRSDYELSDSIMAGSSLCYDTLGLETPNPRFTARAAAGLHTTITDFAAFAVAGLEAGSLGECSWEVYERPGRGVLQSKTIAAMIAPAAVSNDQYGLGYQIDRTSGGDRWVGHGGANRGWMARFWVVPATGDGIVVTTNGSNGQAVIQQIIAAWAGRRSETKPEFRRPFSLPVVRALLEGGTEAAERAYARVKADGEPRYSFDESQLNRIGYELLGHGRVGDAVAIFKLNVKAYPDAFNVYDSLGEAYLMAGNRKLALENYEKSIKLNPENESGRRAIEKLKKR